ncbi:hypothetical protein JCM8547_003156 [Rhodosporidiobolus lusitaniae]
MPSRAELEATLSRCSSLLVLRASASNSSKDLVELDAWYRGELRELVKKRREKNEDGKAELTVKEVGKLMEWKLARGKWRPRLHSLALSNPDSLVRSTTSSASLAAPSSALTELSKLKGLGPATASAILALWYPETEPFMSDEAMENCEAYGEGEEGQGKREYTAKAWKVFGEKMRERKEKEEWDTVEELEKALWSWAVERKYGGEEKGSEDEEEKPKKRGKKRKSDVAEESSTTKKAKSK